MFTGIIQATGELAACEAHGDDLRLGVQAPLADIGISDSIAVNGVCLTAIATVDGGFYADVSRETLALTTLGDLEVGAGVNLEPAAKSNTLLGGHIVLGHVDGVGRITGIADDARSLRLEVELPAALMRYVAVKGAVTVDGVSLTVNSVDGNRFGVNIVPYTRVHTIIAGYQVGTRVNIECDIIARYVERLMESTLGAVHAVGQH